MKKYVIIVAGGSGTRMNSAIPKQFLKIGGIPILMRSIQAFRDCSEDIEIILVISVALIKQWEELCVQHKFSISHKIAFGGKTRFHSVKNGIALVEYEDSLVAVHDGVRPFVSKNIIMDVFQSAEKYGTAIPCLKINDSVRIIENGKTMPFNRELIYFVQTPQCFQTQLIKKAYEQKFQDWFTDDATVVESLGADIHIVKGELENIKITTPMDLIIAEALLNNRKY